MKDSARTGFYVFKDSGIFIGMQGGLWQKLYNSTIFGAAIVGLLSGSGCIYHLEKTRGLLTQGEWVAYAVFLPNTSSIIVFISNFSKHVFADVPLAERP